MLDTTQKTPYLLLGDAPGWVKNFLVENLDDIDINYKYENGETLLIRIARLESVSGNHEDLFEYLLARNADVNGSDITGRTPLHYSAMKGYAGLVKMLISRSGMDIDRKDIDGATALMLASESGEMLIVKMLLEHKANAALTDKFGRNAMQYYENGKKKKE